MGKWMKNYRAKLLFSEYYMPEKDKLTDVFEYYAGEGKKLAIWGGGIKGQAFVNIADPKNKYISFVIDINPERVRAQFAGKRVISCYDLKEEDVDVIFMMSQKHFVQNYNILQDMGIKCILHDVDEIVKRSLSVEEIISNIDMESDNTKDRKITESVQKELMPILHEVKRVCDKNSIPYFLCAGSALGAVRHQGFIPWDDDIDVGMLRKDYIKFMEVAGRELKEGFLLIDANDTPDYYVGHAKVFKNNTALVNRETSHLRIHHGFYLDIFPFDTIPDEPEKQDRMYAEVNKIKLMFVRMKKWNRYFGRNPFKRFIVNKDYYLLKRRSGRRVFKKMNKTLTKYLYSDYEMTADLFAPYNKKLFYRMKDIYPVKMLKFEDDFYPVPGNTDKYLTVMYGDYMKLPPEDKRYVKHDIICFDTKNNYINDAKWMKKYFKG